MKAIVSARRARRKKPSFFLFMAVVALLAVLIGFSKTFFFPLSQGSFKAPWMVHLHGAFAFAWIILFLVQNATIHFRKYYVHQILGYFGIMIAAGVGITMVPVGLFTIEKELGLGFGLTAYSGFLGVLTSGLMFFCLVMAGIYFRKKP